MASFLQLMSMSLIPVLAAAAFPSEGLVQATERTRASGGVQCEIRASKARGGIELQAVVVADRSAQGQYDFVVKSQSGGGSSDISQGGEFVLRKGEEQVLGVVSVGSGARPAYRARLQVKDARGNLLCEAESI